MSAIVYLVILFNASNWGSYGIKRHEFASMADCSQALAEMRIENHRPNSGVAVVAYCAPDKP